jgi:hypothetical protein
VSEYQPGYCNIGHRQRRRRLAYAAGSFGSAVLVVLGYAMGVVARPLLIGVFIPLSLGFEFGLQAYSAFCVRLALLNRYDFRGATDGRAGEVTDPKSRHVDQVYAVKITIAAVVLSAATTAVVVFISG